MGVLATVRVVQRQRFPSDDGGFRATFRERRWSQSKFSRALRARAWPGSLALARFLWVLRWLETAVRGSAK